MRRDGRDCAAVWESLRRDVVGTLWHRVGIAEVVVTVAAAGDDTGVLEPLPGSGNLTTIAVE